MQQSILFKQLQTGAILITPNQRLALTVSQHYSQWMLSQGHRAWPSVNIYAFSTYINTLWYTACKRYPLPRLLKPFELHCLWKRVISEHHDTNSLLSLTKTCEKVKSAWDLVQNYQLDWQHDDFSHTPEHRTFTQWCTHFLSYCESLNVIDSASITRTLCNLPDILPERLLLLAFMDFTPAQTKLLEQLENYEHINLSGEIAPITVAGYESPEHESASVLEQAYQYVQSSQQSVAVVVPDIISRKPILQSQMYRLDPTMQSFNTSLGQALSQYPIIAHALLTLSMGNYEFDLYRLSEWIRSPFISNSETEINGRAALDANLRDLGKHRIRRETLLLQADTDCPQLASGLKTYPKRPHGKQCLEKWGNYFTAILQHIDWPGERILNSAEHQCMHAFQENITQLAWLYPITGDIEFHHALQLLQEMCLMTTFQPENNAKGPQVHVLGLLEAAGLPFSQMICLSSTTQHWPEPLSPNPYLPNSLQKQLQLPHACSEHELQVSLKLITQFRCQCSALKMTYAKHCEGLSQTLSPLFQDFPHEAISLQSQPFVGASLEVLKETHAPRPHQDALTGGVHTLRELAACPFRAVAQTRWRVEPLGRPLVGIAPIERGILVHAAIAFFWQQLQSLTGKMASLYVLTALSEEALAEHIHTAANKAVAKTLDQQTLPLMRELEIKRLERLLAQWLNIEKSRPPFYIHAIEKSFTVPLGPLSLKVRIDRMDLCEDGNYLVLDYKTGYTQVGAWFGERPDDPQLPLYTCIDPAIKGIAIATLKSGHLKLRGVASTQYAKGIDTLDDWDAQRQSWQTELNDLLKGYLEGHAVPDPKYGAQTCMHCHCQTLCRIDDTTVALSSIKAR